MSEERDRPGDHMRELIADDQAERDWLYGHEWCSGHYCDLSDDTTDCPLWLDPTRAAEDADV